jgi:aminopeptidase
MNDSRINRLADILVNYSTKVKKGDTVQIRTDEQGKPLALAVFSAILKAGGHPRMNIRFEETNELFYKHASKHQVEHPPKIDMFETKNTQAVIAIAAPTNTRLLSNIDPKIMMARSKITRPVSQYIVKNLRWVICNFPTPALAQDADMSLEDYEDFVYKATNIDWKKIDKLHSRLKRIFEKGDKVRIVGTETDLSFSIKDRVFVKANGECNMPDGEIFSAPLENSAEGYIRYDFPVVTGGKEIDGIRLVFKKGRIVEASAEKNESYLLASLDADPGARRLGEFGIGTNYGIRKFTKNILFDEKIGGTIHLAIGMAYPECGGKNKSAVHWDMIKDLRKGGKLYLDDKLVQKNGKFLI